MEIRVNVEKAIRCYLYSIESEQNNISRLWDYLASDMISHVSNYKWFEQ